MADVVIFAAETVGDAATFEEPTLPSTGIASVRMMMPGLRCFEPI